MSWSLKSYSGGKICGITDEQFIVKRKIIQYYVKYMAYYFDNKALVDSILKKNLVLRSTKRKRQYTIFKSLLLNPLRSSADVGNGFGVTGGTIRKVVYVTCKKLSDDPIMKPLIKLFKEIVFGRLKEKEIICKELS